MIFDQDMALVEMLNLLLSTSDEEVNDDHLLAQQPAATPALQLNNARPDPRRGSFPQEPQATARNHNRMM